MALIANPISISPKFHRHMGPLAPQSPSAGSLAHNQSSLIDGSQISPPSQLWCSQLRQTDLSSSSSSSTIQEVDHCGVHWMHKQPL
jgi:hypothetical protein